MSDCEHEVERLFRGLLELGEGVDCEAYLSRECRGDESVRRRVEALVRAYRGAGDFLEEDVVGERLDGGGGGLAGRRVAGYRVLRLVSGGASCVVYLAEQLEPVRRPVALKLSRPGEGVERARIRFAAERQAMALLDHPNVVQLYDAGEWEGLPFIVSEWVGGESLLEYAEREQLGVGARLELFLQACLGVVHGHERGVVHRDIKPANILVTEREGVALVKVIDFGVSAASGHELGGGEGTPGYMSPEQLVRGVGAADVREDVYGLGVILHELLTGTRPRVEPGVGWVIEQDCGDSGLPVELERWMACGLGVVLRRALAWGADGRYGNVMEMVRDVRGCMGVMGDGGLGAILRRHRGLMAVAGVIGGVGLAWLVQVVWESHLGRRGGAAGVGLYRQREVEAMGRSDISEALYWATRGVGDVGMERVVGGMAGRVALPVRTVRMDGLVRFLGFSPSGAYVAMLMESGECLVWDWGLDERVLGGEGWMGVGSVGWAERGDFLAVGRADGMAEVWDVAGGDRVVGVDFGERVSVIGFGGGGRYLGVGGRNIRIWDMERSGWLGEGWEHPDEVYGLEFSVGADRVVTACEDGRARVFRMDAGGRGFVLVGEYPHARGLAVESSELCCENALIETDEVVPLLVGERGVLTWSGLGRVSYWERGLELGVVGETCHATRMVRSAGGEWVAVVLRKGGLEYRLARDFGLEVGKRVEHGERVFDIDFDVGRGCFLTASADRTVGVWGLGHGRLAYPLMKHAREVIHGDISADGRRVVTAQLDGQVRVWELPELGLFPESLWDGELVELEEVVRGRVLARVGAGSGDLAWLRDAGGKVVWDRLAREGEYVDASACRENSALAVVRTDAGGGYLEVRRGDVRVERALPFIPGAVAWGGAGLLVMSDTGGSLWKAGLDEGESGVGQVKLLAESVLSGGGHFEISGGGGYVVCWRGREVAGVIAIGTGERIGVGRGGRLQMDLSPVEDVCVVVEGGDQVRVRGLADWGNQGAVLRHAGGVVRHTFSEDGAWVATAGHDGRTLVWDWRSGAMVCPPLVHGEEVVDLIFGGDSGWIATLSRAGVLRLWDTASGFLLSPDWGGLELGTSVHLVDLGGDLLVAAGERGWIWRVDGGDGMRWEEAGLLGEVISGLGGDRGELLGSRVWAERLDRLQGLRSNGGRGG